MPKKVDRSKLDLVLLGRLLKESRTGINRQGLGVLYLVPRDLENIKLCQFVLEKNGIKTKDYFSSAHDGPVLIIETGDIKRLKPAAQEFLYIVAKSDDYPNMVKKEMDNELKRKKTVQQAMNKSAYDR